MRQAGRRSTAGLRSPVLHSHTRLAQQHARSPRCQPLASRPVSSPSLSSPVASMQALQAGQRLAGGPPRPQQRQRQQRRPGAAAAAVAPAAAQAATTQPGGLSPQQVAQFHEDGFLAIPGFASQQQVAALMGRANQLVEAFDPASQGSGPSIFTTDEQQKHAEDAYFLDSASNISFFWEEKAFDAAGRLSAPKALAINKIGHAMHDLDPAFREFTRAPAMAALLRSLGFVRPLPVQSMYIFKQPSIGGEVTPHQDSSFLYTSPPSCVGLWLALEDANVSNGCLWGLKGVHKDGLARRFRRTPGGGVGFDAPAPSYDLSAFEPIECPAGTLVLLHGANVHYSAENRSPVSRHSWALHVVESGPGVAWDPDNWAQRPAELPWTPLYDDAGAAAAGAGGGSSSE